MFSLNPLGIGEGFERNPEQSPLVAKMGLNPQGIGEGFERTHTNKCLTWQCLNPLGIGEGFEL